jgi:hypothetical protein
MESVVNNPTYKYQINTNSKVTYNSKTNCCFISSFQIQMKNQWNDFASLDDLINWLYPNTSNAYTHFAYDFPKKWFNLKQICETKNKIWTSRLDNVILGLFLPLIEQNKCVLLTYIDLNQIVPKEVNEGNTQSLEKSFMDKVPEGKVPINIIQLYNHFEPIQINEQVGKLVNIEQVANKHFLG